MRISEFAKKFGLSTSTVRYYINQGLLMPDRKKDQYNFGAECVDDIKKLLKYKKARFSLDEIQELFFLEKTSHFRDEVSVTAWKDIMYHKKRELLKEQEDLSWCLQTLEDEIRSMSYDSEHVAMEYGVPCVSAL
jgi:DNA-binding transcriptional MerR regulator